MWFVGVLGIDSAHSHLLIFNSPLINAQPVNLCRRRVLIPIFQMKREACWVSVTLRRFIKIWKRARGQIKDCWSLLWNQIIKMEDVWSGPEPWSTDRTGIFTSEEQHCFDILYVVWILYEQLNHNTSEVLWYSISHGDWRWYKGKSRIINLSVGQKWQILENKKLCSVNKY